MARRWCFVVLPLVVLAAAADNPSVVQDTEETLVLTKDICMDGHQSAYLGSHCCKSCADYDVQAEYCASKLGHAQSMTENEKIVFLSKLSECIYKKKKYIKDDRTLNIGHVKADAAKLEDPLARKYMLNMYRSCGREAKKGFNTIEELAKSSPASRKLVDSIHKPYFMFVYSCCVHFSEKHQCPYFRWNDKGAGGQKCEEYSRECKTLLKKET